MATGFEVKFARRQSQRGNDKIATTMFVSDDGTTGVPVVGTTVFPLAGEAVIPTGRVCVDADTNQEEIPGVYVTRATYRAKASV